MWNFMWLDIDTSLQTNDSKWLDSFCDSTLTPLDQVITLETIPWLHEISVQVLSSHLVASSPGTVRPCSPWGGRWIGHWRTTWQTVCSSAPHSQATEETIPNLYKQERKRPTPVRRRLSRTQALLWRVIPGRWVPVSRMRMRSFMVLSVHTAFHWWSAYFAVRFLSLSDEQMICCAASTNGCLDLRRRAFALDRPVSAEWSRCPDSMARGAMDNVVAPLRQRSAGWMPARIGRLSVGVGRRHPVTGILSWVTVTLVKWGHPRETT